MNQINIFQKNWAFTAADAEKPQITTGSFGPCYVVTFTSEKFAAMAHIDDCTNVESIKIIFNKFLENSVELQEVKVIILGGWKQHPESFKWGQKILKIISESNFKTISTKNMFSKLTPTPLQTSNGISKANIHNYYYFGALVDATNGKTFLVHDMNHALEEEQDRQIEQFAQQYASTLDAAELPVQQITS